MLSKTQSEWLLQWADGDSAVSPKTLDAPERGDLALKLLRISNAAHALLLSLVDIKDGHVDLTGLDALDAEVQREVLLRLDAAAMTQITPGPVVEHRHALPRWTLVRAMPLADEKQRSELIGALMGKQPDYILRNQCCVPAVCDLIQDVGVGSFLLFQKMDGHFGVTAGLTTERQSFDENFWRLSASVNEGFIWPDDVRALLVVNTAQGILAWFDNGEAI